MQTSAEVSIAVEGIEATQATQFYRSFRHLDESTVEPDGAVPLVAEKPLALRVYPDVRHPAIGQQRLIADGELWFRRGDADTWRQADRFLGDVPAQRAELTDRGDARQTLNFRIPKQFAEGTLWVRTRVWVELLSAERLVSDWLEQTLRFQEMRPLRLHLYGVHYRHEGLDLPPASAADVLETLSFLRKTYPIAEVEVLSYETLEYSGDLAAPRHGVHQRGWRELLLILSRLRAARVSDVIHYALLPKEVPDQGWVGFGSSLRVGASMAHAGSTMAQEIGHVLHRRHAPGGGAHNTDPEYPTYNGYASSSIGEFGFDPTTGQVFTPAASFDFMGYCDSNWVSPFTYRALAEVFAMRSAGAADTAHAENGSQQAYLHLGFCLRAGHRFELESGLTLSGPPVDPCGEATPYRLELRDREHRVLHSQRVHLRSGQLDSEDELYFMESLPLLETARQIVFICCPRHAPVTLDIPRDELKVGLVSPTNLLPNETRSGIIHLQWDVKCHRPERLAFFLRYTCDGGASWQPVSIGLQWDRCRVDLDRLPGGEHCRLQLIASTILQTAVAETATFRVRRKRRRAMIAGGNSRRISSGDVLELTGTAHAPDGFAGERELRWSSNLQGQLGTGSYLALYDLLPGEHEVTLTAPDGLGGETTARTLVEVATGTSK